MKNLLKDFSGEKNSTGTPKEEAIVVMTEAITKYRINIGKTADSFTCLPVDLDLRARTNANTSVIGMIANVRVSFTVTALSNVAEPSPYRESQVEAAAVTEDVSFTAVPAKIPNASPLTAGHYIYIQKNTAIRRGTFRIWTESVCCFGDGQTITAHHSEHNQHISDHCIRAA